MIRTGRARVLFWKDALSISVSLVRWPRTFTTCWTAMDTSWTVEVSSRWRGRAKWPLTSSPAALRRDSVKGGGDHGVTPSGLQKHPRVSTRLSSEALCKQEQMTSGNHKQCLSACCRVATCTRVDFLHVWRLPPPPMLLERSQSPVALEWKWQCFSRRAIQVVHLEVFILCR